MTSDPAEQIGERSMKAWNDLGQWMARRPMQMIGTILGLVLTVILVYSALQTKTNEVDISNIQKVFCSAEDTPGPQQRENCQKLLDQLLKNPTPQQTARLREIVEEAP
jgi:hypothetical protein